MKKDEFQERIYNGIRECLKRRGYGSVAAAQRFMGVSNTYFADIRRGKGQLSISHLGSLLEFLEIEPEDFFRDTLRDELELIRGITLKGKLPRAIELLGSEVDDEED